MQAAVSRWLLQRVGSGRAAVRCARLLARARGRRLRAATGMVLVVGGAAARFALAARAEALLQQRREVDHLRLARRAPRLGLGLHLALRLFLDHLHEVVAVGVV